jgi:crotonobetainyl-CoA:carnitine CoA-transferase CaiB-like acyl-CoA transferase
MLADLGAEVIKVEPPGGDRWRQQAPVAPGESRPYLGVNRGKRGTVLDLRREEGRAVLLRLIDRADVFLTNFRPGVAERLGVGYEQLSARNPRLVYGENTAFGAVGPERDRPGFDLLSQATSGVMDYERKLRDGLPQQISTTAIADITSAAFLAQGVVAALYTRTRTGRGQRVSTSLLQSAITIQYRPLLSIERLDAEPRAAFLQALAEAGGELDYEHILALREALIPGRPAASTGNNYYRVYRTADGFVAVACLNNRFRRRLRDLVGVEDPAVDGDAYTWTGREDREHHDRLRPRFEAAFRSATSAEWLARLDAADVPCTPMRLTEELFDAPQIAANEMILTLEHPTLGPIRQPAGAIRMSDTPSTANIAAPTLGQHTDAILAEAGYSAAEIAALRDQGAVQ